MHKMLKSFYAYIDGFVALIAFGGHFAAFLSFQDNIGRLAVHPDWTFQAPLLIGVSLALSFTAILSKRQALFLLAIGIQFVVHLVLSLPHGDLLVIEYIMTMVFVVQTVAYGQRRLHIILPLAYIAVMLAAQQPILAWRTLVPPATPLQLALFSSFSLFVFVSLQLLRYFSLHYGERLDEIARLEKTVNLLSTANLDFQEYANRVARDSSEKERMRITREIHDSVGYALVNLRMMMEDAMDRSSGYSPELVTFLGTARDQALEAHQDIRSALRSFRQMEIGRPKGKKRLQHLVGVFESATKVSVRVHFGNIPDSFDPEVDDVVYRLVQEALTNSFRHGKATEIGVYFWLTEQQLRVKVVDNGVGAKGIQPGIGLNGMRERLQAVDGALDAASQTTGFYIYAEIPWPRPEHHEESRT